MKHDLSKSIQNSLEIFEQNLKDILASDVPYADFILKYVGQKRGKRIRPVLVFLTAQLHGDINHNAIQSALLVEMLHTATLIHDDVVDESDQRRGARTINDRWNNKTAVLIGDYLFSKTLSGMIHLNNRDISRLLAEASEKIAKGELLQIAVSGRSDLSESQYYNIIEYKTATLFKVACQFGVLCNNGDKKDLDHMEKFGTHFGMAFQIMDDVLDYTGSSGKMGKPLCKDIQEKKLTLPLIHTLEQNDSNFSALIERGLDQGFTQNEIDQIQAKVLSAGGIEYAINHANHRADRALDILNRYPESKARESIEKLVSSSTNREY